ncbi:MAG: hypothetical protein CFE37_07630 [Alphaproteobacteria bacterium PA4]|nr:MAG: hypothetical protein CFE37_07630 [Alphaproteobacteria bacterium PA4]
MTAPATAERLPPPVADPAPLVAERRGVSWWLSAGISIAILIAVLWQLRSVSFTEMRAMLPTNPWFWVAFGAAYFSAPLIDFAIFKRLWDIPAAGFGALLKKLIGNELLMGYIGEVYFYTWARRRTGMVSAPFGAVKDVAILSALMGNAVTLVMLALAYPLLGSLHLGIESRTLMASVAVVLVTSSLVLLFRRQLFSLPRPELLFVSGMHLLRIALTTGCNAWAWHLVLPQVGIQWWLLLSAMRLLLSRLPLLPNKDIVFAGLAVFLVGHDADIAALMTMMASLILATHLALGLMLAAGDATKIKAA